MASRVYEGILTSPDRDVGERRTKKCWEPLDLYNYNNCEMKSCLTVTWCAWNVHRVCVPASRKVCVMRNSLASYCRPATINWRPCSTGCQPVKPRKKAQLDWFQIYQLWRWGPLSKLTRWTMYKISYIFYFRFILHEWKEDIFTTGMENFLTFSHMYYLSVCENT